MGTPATCPRPGPTSDTSASPAGAPETRPPTGPRQPRSQYDRGARRSPLQLDVLRKLGLEGSVEVDRLLQQHAGLGDLARGVEQQPEVVGAVDVVRLELEQLLVLDNRSRR